VSEPRIIPIELLDFTLEPKPWAFALERRAEIDAHFEKLKHQKPALWNGRVLLMHRYTIEGGALRGAFLETDYASFVAWQDWGRPEAGIYDCFGAAAIQSADGGYLLGVMAAHTYNADDIYFPCGTPDPKDVTGNTVDFEFSLRRELNEETGLDANEFEPKPGWFVVFDKELIAAIKVMRSKLTAEILRARILHQMAREKQPELADILIVRSAADFHPNMRRFVSAFLAYRFDPE
jgi:8-oxo-dGTP pyrophosphatase MutT (NUDIX family)